MRREGRGSRGTSGIRALTIALAVAALLGCSSSGGSGSAKTTAPAGQTTTGGPGAPTSTSTAAGGFDITSVALTGPQISTMVPGLDGGTAANASFQVVPRIDWCGTNAIALQSPPTSLVVGSFTDPAGRGVFFEYGYYPRTIDAAVKAERRPASCAHGVFGSIAGAAGKGTAVTAAGTPSLVGNAPAGSYGSRFTIDRGGFGSEAYFRVGHVLARLQVIAPKQAQVDQDFATISTQMVTRLLAGAAHS